MARKKRKRYVQWKKILIAIYTIGDWDWIKISPWIVINNKQIPPPEEEEEFIPLPNSFDIDIKALDENVKDQYVNIIKHSSGDLSFSRFLSATAPVYLAIIGRYYPSGIPRISIVVSTKFYKVCKAAASRLRDYKADNERTPMIRVLELRDKYIEEEDRYEVVKINRLIDFLKYLKEWKKKIYINILTGR